MAQFGYSKYSPDGRFVVVASHGGGGGITVFEAVPGKVIYKVEKRLRYAFSDDGKQMLVSKNQKNALVEILDTDSWKPVFSRKKTHCNRTSFELSKDGQKVLIGLNDCRVES